MFNMGRLSFWHIHFVMEEILYSLPFWEETKSWYKRHHPNLDLPFSNL